jgi:hypothetical protein
MRYDRNLLTRERVRIDSKRREREPNVAVLQLRFLTQSRSDAPR